jgi:hypothetical protein
MKWHANGAAAGVIRKGLAVAIQSDQLDFGMSQARKSIATELEELNRKLENWRR